MSDAQGRRAIFVSGDQCEIGGIVGGNVGMRLQTAEIDALLPALDLVIRLQPSEARRISAALAKWADLVEGAPQ